MAQTLGQDTAPEPSMAWVFVSLLICLCLAAGVAWLLKFKFPGLLSGQIAGQRMKLVQTLRINPHVTVALIEIDGCTHVIATGPQGATLLMSDLKPQDEAVQP